MDAGNKASQKAIAEAERKAALLKAKEDVRLESDRKKQAALEAALLVEQTKNARLSSSEKLKEGRRLALEANKKSKGSVISMEDAGYSKSSLLASFHKASNLHLFQTFHPDSKEFDNGETGNV